MRKFLVLWGAILLAWYCVGAQAFGAVSPALSRVIEGAKKEGSVNLGLTLRAKSHGKPAGELYLAAFQKRYPFLKVNFKRVGGAQERERILTEMTAGVVNFDVITVSETMETSVRGIFAAGAVRAGTTGQVITAAADGAQAALSAEKLISDSS